MAEPYESVGSRVMRQFRHVIYSTVHYWLPVNSVEPSEGMTTTSPSDPTTSGESGNTSGTLESSNEKVDEQGVEEGHEEGTDEDDDDNGEAAGDVENEEENGDGNDVEGVQAEEEEEEEEAGGAEEDLDAGAQEILNQGDIPEVLAVNQSIDG